MAVCAEYSMMKTFVHRVAGQESANPVALFRRSGGILQRKCACGQHTGGGACADCGKKKQEAAQSGGGTLQRRTAGIDTSAHGASSVPPIVHDVLRSPGQPLDTAARSFFEPRFDYDFSHVRVHTDARAAESARAVNALAYTFGCQIVFAADQYESASMSGQKLLAHELTHVIQQHGSHALSPSGISEPGHATETEARAAESSPEVRPPLASASTATIQRQPGDSSGSGKEKKAASEKREKPSVGAGLCAEHPNESLIKKNPKFCMDTSATGVLNKGRCYREIPSGSDCPPGKHICFDSNSGKCDSSQSHIDHNAPTLSRDKSGMCDVWFLGACSISHLFTDVIPDLVQTAGQAICTKVCEDTGVPKAFCAIRCAPSPSE